MTQTFYSHGKLLLTSEYLVLDGAKALALPTNKGQELNIQEITQKELRWKSILDDGTVWIQHTFTLPLQAQDDFSNPVIAQLHKILIETQNLKSGFLSNSVGYEATSTLEFPKNWGLGSSSTLIANIAAWADVDPYVLLKKTFGGSGYDIACASSEQAIIYQTLDEIPRIENVDFRPDFAQQLFFVHLNKKQNSRESIEHYRSLNKKVLHNEIKIFSQLTERILSSVDLDEFERLLTEHEDRLSRILKTPTVKERLFSDYPHAIKSLGGWGGDFILAIGGTDQMKYFKKKGFHTIVPFAEMVL